MMDNYIQSEVWRGNHYLVQPISYSFAGKEFVRAAKQCRTCVMLDKQQTFHFSTWFYDAVEFVDGKLPICAECWREKAAKEFKKTLTETRQCKKCSQPKPLYSFGVYKDHNCLRDVCKACSHK